MKLSVREVAKMFDASERTIERWVRDDGMPYEKVHGQLRFHRAEVLEWANHRSIRIVEDAPMSRRSGMRAPSLADALVHGGVHAHVPATDRESALRAVIERMPIADAVDRELVFEVFLARENAGSTGVGDGIAIPHVRNPLVLDVDAPSVSLCLLETPVDFHAIDGKPVHTIFAIVAPTARVHLALLARLAGVLHDKEFRAAILERAPSDELLAIVRRAEARFVAQSAEGAADLGDEGEGA